MSIMAVERFEKLPPDLEKVIQPIEAEEYFGWEDYEKSQVVLTSVLDQFYQRTRGKILADDAKRIAFKEIINSLSDEEKEMLLEVLEREI